MSRRDLSVKGGTSERWYRTRRGRTDEQRYAIISPYFDGRIKMNGLYPEITNISFLAKLFFKTFISLKHLSDYRTIRLSDYSYGPNKNRTPPFRAWKRFFSDNHSLFDLHTISWIYFATFQCMDLVKKIF